ncbi:interleukin-1 receptor-associated kinase 4-like [Hydra vulgaris]|uniref:interleukin-1 receptor-associated kinase 4-like n=1 Tax=Hydra vulgaris TaxID=6087 RepID=UPI0032E9BECA
MPLAQIVKRLGEIDCLDNKFLRKKHKSKVVPGGKDGWFFLKSGQLAQVIEINFNSLLCEIIPCRLFNDFFVVPCSSRYNKILSVPKNASVKRKTVQKTELKRKVISFKGRIRNVVFPLCHDSIWIVYQLPDQQTNLSIQLTLNSLYLKKMSFFTFKISELEKKVQHLEIPELSINFDQLIGEGSAAKVYQSTIRKQQLAVKVFKTQFSKKRVFTVCEELRQIQHKNIVNFIGYSVRPSALCFEICCVHVHDTFVYSLKELINIFNDNDYFNLNERVSYLTQACEGIMYLHEKNIIHGDIKPTNMLVCGSIQNLIIKISDFGDMTTIKNTVTCTTNNYLKGITICYVAPELLHQNKNKLSVFTDIYAFSISSFEILSNLCSPWEKNFL